MLYRNTSENELMIPNVGVVKAGETMKSEFKLENPNLKEVTEPAPEPATPPIVPVATPTEKSDNKE